MTTRPIPGAVALLILLACGGDPGPAGIRRLAGEAWRPVMAARESRPATDARESRSFDADLGPGCTLHVGYANLASDTALAFDVDLRRGGAWERVHAGRAEPDAGWVDARIALGPRGVRGLRLRSSATADGAGAWSRPVLACARGRDDRPNVLLVSLDTLRADRVGAYGSDAVPTPNLDRWAREGALFERAFAQAPNTLHSHASLFTSRYASQLGWLGIPDAASTLAEVLAEAGYATAAFTENAFVGSDWGFAQGFDLYHDGPTIEERLRSVDQADATFARGLAWLERRPDAPFFLFLHTYEAHVPYHPPASVLERLGVPPLEPFDEASDGPAMRGHNRGRHLPEAEIERLRRLYEAEVATLDDHVGALREGLEAMGLLDETLVVVFADHGEAFDEHGRLGHGSLHDEVLHVPLILRLPGVIPGGRRVSGPVALLDVAPLVAELAGVGEAFASAPGRNLLERLRKREEAGGAPVVSERVVAGCGGGDCPYEVAIRDGASTCLHEPGSDAPRLLEDAGGPPPGRPPQRGASDAAERCRVLAEAHRAWSRSRATPRDAVEVDASMREALHALGYVE